MTLTSVHTGSGMWLAFSSRTELSAKLSLYVTGSDLAGAQIIH